MHEKEFSSLLKTKDLFFLVGSGISLTYPSCLPSAFDVLNLTAEFTFPKEEDHYGELGVRLGQSKQIVIKNILKKIQPEVFYEHLLKLVGPMALLPWEMLHSYKTRAEISAHNQNIRPNLGHFAVVWFSHRNKLPIITTNFDAMFEDAAEVLGFKPIVYVPHSKSHEQYLEHKCLDNEVLIWKVHGSIDIRTPDGMPSVMTTMARISQLNSKLLASVEKLLNQKSLCLLGYSGRDIDLFFPLTDMRAKLQAPQPCYWINPVFKKEPNQLKPEDRSLLERANLLGVRGIGSFLDDLLPSNEKSLLLESLDNRGVAISKLAHPSDGKWNQEKENIKTALIASERLRIAQESPIPQEVKEYFLALMLKESGYYLQSYRYLRGRVDRLAKRLETIDPNLSAYVLLTLASLSHETSKYKEVERRATEALKIRGTEFLPKIEGRCLVAEAKRMQANGRLGYADNKMDMIRSNLTVLPKLCTTALSIKKLLPSPQGSDLYDTTHTGERDFTLRIHSWENYLEHRIRLIAFLQGAAYSFGLGKLSFVRNWFDSHWNAIRETSSSVGYAGGIANAGKYFSRLPGFQSPNRRDPQQIYSLLSIETGKAIVERDMGQEMLDKKKMPEAFSHFKKCFMIAFPVGNYSLALKGLLGMYNASQKPLPRQLLNYLEGEIEGEGYRRWFKRISKHNSLCK